MCLLQIATVKSQVGLEMFQKNVRRKFWSLGEEFSIDGKLLKDEKIPRSMKCFSFLNRHGLYAKHTLTIFECLCSRNLILNLITVRHNHTRKTVPAVAVRRHTCVSESTDKSGVATVI